MEEQQHEGDISQPLEPVEQQALMFYGQPLVVVRLADGRVGAVLRWLFDNLQLDPTSQMRRIRRTEAIVHDLVYVRVQTDGGPQVMPTLVLHAVPFWLAGIDPKRVREEMRPAVRRYVREVVDVLYAWAQTPRAPTVVPSEPVVQPARPDEDAPLAAWRDYYASMVALVEWQMDVETWRGNVETRLEGLEAVTDLIPEILDRLGPQTLTPAHQNRVKYLVSQLSQASGTHPATIYSGLYTAFSVPRYQELSEEEWPLVEQWFSRQLDRLHEKGE